ncbi:DNA mismatch repair protein MutS [Roseibium hamelinense]|uniref:DNA mismatch repair protein MutS n=1 Tax=Roseibium hamelinense TaxID=150831 RepID=A0A562SQ05_9HYPH|nr:DNA mismatch repair protein MutS [Roseibium hamelinense]MTI44387.1 DNA mismatch repair protein MutS [Roseibium hamelinense]TWI82836.1 DNA mismatch repair protein MutS [Roseibium hamelinense]
MSVQSAQKAGPADAKVTPMMAQYIEIKTANPDSLLFYRMGDFYELFFEDAEVAARALGITLTKRGKHQGEDIPMCGVPVHAADDYLQKLIALGHRVSVCEQTEDPAEAKKRGSKSVVRRDVVRLVTPGTITEDRLLDAGANNFLAALTRLRGSSLGGDAVYGLAWVDMSTGSFQVCETDDQRLASDIVQISPRELILADNLLQEKDFRQTLEQAGAALSPVPRAYFDSATATDKLAQYFGVKTLDGFGVFSRAELSAASGILSYIEKTQLGERPPLDPPARQSGNGRMLIDPATRSNLELSRTLSGEKQGSLLATIDKTVTGSGSRLLASRLAAPLLDPEAISKRQDAVEFFFENEIMREGLRQTLKGAPDMARSLSRIALHRGGPRDVLAIATGLRAVRTAFEQTSKSAEYPAEIAAARTALGNAPHDLGAELDRAIKEDPPLLKRDGGFIASGYDENLDELRALRDESRKVIAKLQADYGEELGLRSLKIKHNSVLGWFIEAPTAQTEKMVADPGRFIHRQTMAGAMRFTTTELADLESKIASAGERALAIEMEIFDRLADAIVESGDLIKAAAHGLGVLDVSAALAKLAQEDGYVRPAIDGSRAFHITGGRHPVVERALKTSGGDAFVANDADLGPRTETDAGSIWLITGPNMAGKSTFLRQNALIAVMAQMGAFVPAYSAHIGIVDRLFSRVGAADDLARGRSTFMVEMVETAAILNQASDRSLVILDEIGRGTATFDGLSIAWASIEHLHEINKSRALFATHYHELTVLSAKLDRLSNATVSVKEWNGDVIFLHEIVPGAADRSYGIQVAKLAGLPPSVVERSKQVLSQLEEQDRSSPAENLIDELPLFATLQPAQPKTTRCVIEPALEELDRLNPDDMTPREALEALYMLKSSRLKNSDPIKN